MRTAWPELEEIVPEGPSSAQPLICPRCRAKMGVWKSNCLRCGADIPLPEAPLAPPSGSAAARRASAGIAVAVVVALAGGAYGTTLMPAAAFTVPDAPNPLLTSLNRPAPAVFRRTRPRASAAGGPARLSNLELHAAGWQSVQAGQLASAVEYYRAAADRTPEDALAHNNLGQVLVDSARPAEAATSFERAVALKPQEAAFHTNLARALGLLGDWDGAVRECAQAVSLDTADARFLHNLAVAQLKRGHLADAAESFRLVTSRAPGQAEAWYGLGVALERLGREAEAAEVYLRSADLGGEAPDAAELRAHAARLRAGPEAPAAPETPSTR